jgi:hypothetical protein
MSRSQRTDTSARPDPALLRDRPLTTSLNLPRLWRSRRPIKKLSARNASFIFELYASLVQLQPSLPPSPFEWFEDLWFPATADAASAVVSPIPRNDSVPPVEFDPGVDSLRIAN